MKYVEMCVIRLNKLKKIDSKFHWNIWFSTIRASLLEVDPNCLNLLKSTTLTYLCLGFYFYGSSWSGTTFSRHIAFTQENSQISVTKSTFSLFQGFCWNQSLSPTSLIESAFLLKSGHFPWSKGQTRHQPQTPTGIIYPWKSQSVQRDYRSV